MKPDLGDVDKNQIVHRNLGRPGPRAARPGLEGWVRPGTSPALDYTWGCQAWPGEFGWA